MYMRAYLCRTPSHCLHFYSAFDPFPHVVGSALSTATAPLERSIAGLTRDVSLHYVLPKTSLTPLLSRGLLSVQQVAYAYVAWKFAFHFLNRDTADIRAIQESLTGGSGSDAHVRLVRRVWFLLFRRASELVAFNNSGLCERAIQ